MSSTQLYKNWNRGTQRSVIGLINRFLIGVYPHAFPIREFIHLKVNFANNTPASFSRYDGLLKHLCTLLNCRALRGESPGLVHLIGRKQSVDYLNMFFTRIIQEIETEISTERDFIKCHGKKGFSTESTHLLTYINHKRLEIIESYCSEIRKLFWLKKTEYLDKYATMRQVRENEILDQTFFPEYIKENRLAHLKQYKWLYIN